MKRKILMDVDGVLNEYQGNYDENYIPPIKKGAKEFIERLSVKYDVKLFSSRDENIVKNWAKEYEIDKFISGITSIKEPCWLLVDDRCVPFRGDYEKTYEDIENYKVWYK